MKWFAADALLPRGPARGVRSRWSDGGSSSVTPGVGPGRCHPAPGRGAAGPANAHSHAFHRALRGRTHADGGNFWTWRERMYAIAGRIDPDTYLALARATYAEMALAGFTSSGSSTTCTTPPAACRTTTPTRWARRCSRPRPTPESG